MPDDTLALLTRKQLAALLQVSPRQLDRLRNERGFPQPFLLGRTTGVRSPRWRRADVQDWLDSQR